MDRVVPGPRKGEALPRDFLRAVGPKAILRQGNPNILAKEILAILTFPKYAIQSEIELPSI